MTIVGGSRNCFTECVSPCMIRKLHLGLFRRQVGAGFEGQKPGVLLICIVNPLTVPHTGTGFISNLCKNTLTFFRY